jgi:hypothetical protein
MRSAAADPGRALVHALLEDVVRLLARTSAEASRCEFWTRGMLRGAALRQRAESSDG